jgi:hypothetical protein
MSFFVRAMKVGVPDGQRVKGEMSRILFASIPFDVKGLVLLDILPFKGLASADHHLTKQQDPSV